MKQKIVNSKHNKFSTLNFKFLTINSSGQFLVELLLAIAISTLILPALITGFVATREGKAQQQQRLDGTTYLKEAQEAIRVLRESGWNNVAALSTGTPYHQNINATTHTWELLPGSITTNGFTTSIVINNVNRDSTGAITNSGGTLDPSTKQFTTTISWTLPYPSSMQTVSYITRTDNLVRTETTQTTFKATGTIASSVKVQATTGSSLPDDGEIILGAGNTRDWCSPVDSLQGQIPLGGGQPNALFTIPGQAFIGTGDNASGISLGSIDVSNPTNAQVTGNFNGYKTNDIYVEPTGHYAYLATDTTNKPVVIVDLQQKDGSGNYVEVSHYELPQGTGKGVGVTVSGNTGFVTVSNRVYAFDARVVSGVSVQPHISYFGLPANGARMKVAGTRLYIAMQGGMKLKVLNISNPALMSNFGQLSLGSLPDTQDIAVTPDGNTTFIVTSHAAVWTTNNVFVVDTTNPNDFPDPIGAYNPDHAFNTQNSSSQGIDQAHGISIQTVGSNIYALIVGEPSATNPGGNQYQVFRVTLSPFAFTYCGGMPLSAGIWGVTSLVDGSGNSYSYILSKPDVNNGTSFKIFAGGSGGTYAKTGIYTSKPYKNPLVVNSTTYNRMSMTYIKPSAAGVDIKFQIGINTAQGACPSDASGFNFVGPNGTNTDFFTTTTSATPITTSYAIPVTINPGQCVAYKVYLYSSNDQATTPTFLQADINYSP